MSIAGHAHMKGQTLLSKQPSLNLKDSMIKKTMTMGGKEFDSDLNDRFLDSPSTNTQLVDKRSDAVFFQTRDPGFTNQILAQQRSRLENGDLRNDSRTSKHSTVRHLNSEIKEYSEQ